MEMMQRRQGSPECRQEQKLVLTAIKNAMNRSCNFAESIQMYLVYEVLWLLTALQVL